MNERIEDLTRQANEGLDGITPGSQPMIDPSFDQFIEKFAELIVGECTRKIEDIAESSNNPQLIYRVAVEVLEHFGVEE